MHRSPILLPIFLFFAVGFCGAQPTASTIPGSSPQATPPASSSPASAPQAQPQADSGATSIPATRSAPPPPGATEAPPSVSGDSAPAKRQTPELDRATAPQTIQKSQAKEPAAETPQTPQPPQEPKTEILDSSATSAALATDGHDPILDPPPFPRGTTTLVGGIISGVDRIRNHLTVSIFGGGRWTVYFDERTHIFHNGAEVTPLALKKGERVYVDTMLDNNHSDIFARNIRVGVLTPPADAAGQIEEVDASRHEFVLRDRINSSSVRFAVDSATRIVQGSKPGTFQDVVAGSLVRVEFAPDQANRGVAREIVILARPGASFNFAGTITFLDTHRNLLSVHNISDNKTYDIFFVPSRIDAAGRLAVGAQIQVVAIFDVTHYAAQQITVTRMAGASH